MFLDITQKIQNDGSEFTKTEFTNHLYSQLQVDKQY